MFLYYLSRHNVAEITKNQDKLICQPIICELSVPCPKEQSSHNTIIYTLGNSIEITTSSGDMHANEF